MSARQPRRCGTTNPRILVNGLWANPPFALEVGARFSIRPAKYGDR